MKEPLLLPFLALAAGIIISHLQLSARPRAHWRWLRSLRYSWSPGWRKIRWAAWTCGLLAVASAGVWLEAYHRPGPAPTSIPPTARPSCSPAAWSNPPTFFPTTRPSPWNSTPAPRARQSLPPRRPARALPLRTEIEIEAKIRTPHNFNNPGSFDNAAYLARQNIFWTATAGVSANVTVKRGRCGSSFWRSLYATRTRALRRIDALYSGDDYNTGMMEAVLIGDSARCRKAGPKITAPPAPFTRW